MNTHHLDMFGNILDSIASPMQIVKGRMPKHTSCTLDGGLAMYQSACELIVSA
jgi:hypothetical protein